jgi:hypothetical protein
MGGMSLREAPRCHSRRGESVGGRFEWRGGDEVVLDGDGVGCVCFARRL